MVRSPSQPLDVQTRAFFEPRIGQSLSRVRVHTDAKAAASALAVNALAVATGLKEYEFPMFDDFVPSVGERFHEIKYLEEVGAKLQKASEAAVASS